MKKIVKLIPLFLLGGLLLHVQPTVLDQGPEKSKEFFKRMKSERITSDQSVLWKNFGPGMSGYCEEFWCHPTDTNVMFMGPDMHVAYGTWDNGKSWHTIKDSDGDGQDLERVLDIAFSSQNPDFAVALERRGKVFTTQDRGRTWTLKHVIPHAAKSKHTNAHTKMAIHPEDDDIWFIGAGDFWNVKHNHRSLKAPRGLIHERAAYGYILKTSDGGETWKKVAQDIAPDSLDVARILIHPTRPNEMVIATNFGVFRSEDTGETWKPAHQGLPNNLPRDLTGHFDPETGVHTLYLVEQTMYLPAGQSIETRGGVFKSTDGGRQWTSITGDLGVDFSQITYYHHRSNYHRVLNHWFGVNSKKAYPEYPRHTYSIFNRIVVNPQDKDELYLVANQRHDKSFGPGDAWKTEDGGKTWKICARIGEYWKEGMDREYWLGKGFELGTNVSFAHLQSSLDVQSETRSANRMLAINSVGEVFIGINQQTLRSNDGGDSWQQVDDFETAPGSGKWIGRGGSNLPGRQMLMHTGIEDRYLLCSGEHGLWQTTDIGDWPDRDAVAVQQIEGQVHDVKGHHDMHSISTVAVHPKDPNTIYILAWRQEHLGKLRRTTDGGKTWENISTIHVKKKKAKNVPYQASLLIDPEDPNHMYFCSIRKPVQEVGGGTRPNEIEQGDYGVYRSTDGGYNWALSNAGLPKHASVRRMVMDPKDPTTIYACINKRGDKDPSGLYVSHDRAQTWEEVPIPANIQGVNNLFIHPESGDMYLSCGYRDGAYSGGGVWKSSNQGKKWKRFFEAPYVWQTEVSTVDPNLMLVNVPLHRKGRGDSFKNPGIYLTRDGGKSWAKINRGLGQPDKMTDIKLDPKDPAIIWCAAWGSGWFKARIDR
ncbi:VPS10 domain-containing protein [Pontibacter sp. G13]|uniref:VPS10 domain-containing protein n=1 Tax=Pontibacter sp. G13 TaxID=3074898 RepID=UPI002889DE6A|nr:hypothetical protein [Pontibacter sp. G13]WNJ19064.1 hypothetical protein RJD25_01115 [Pontibacter sp. G13]